MVSLQPNSETMNAKILVLFVLFSAINSMGFAQDKSKKQVKQELRIENQTRIANLIDAREFVFIAKTANPQGFSPVGLTGEHNYIKFSPDLVESSLPFFGNVYGSYGFGSDEGLKFEGKPEEFAVKEGRKNYHITVRVNGAEGGVYRLILSISFDGNTAVSISSNNRSNISFNGMITEPEDKK